MRLPNVFLKFSEIFVKSKTQKSHKFSSVFWIKCFGLTHKKVALSTVKKFITRKEINEAEKTVTEKNLKLDNKLKMLIG